MIRRYLRIIKEDGLAETHHKNGQVKTRDNYKKGRKDGLSEWYYDNGQLGSRGNYKNGEKDGMWEEYYDNGELEKKEYYANGIKIHKKDWSQQLTKKPMENWKITKRTKKLVADTLWEYLEINHFNLH